MAHPYGDSSSPFIGVTSNMIDYAPKCMPERAKDSRPQNNNLEYCMPHGSYNGTASEYRERYKDLPIQPRMPPARRPATTNSSAKFEGTSTNHSDYQKWPLQKRTPASHVGDTNVISDGRPHSLDDRTTYHNDFWDKSKSIPKPDRGRHHVANIPTSSAKFCGETTNHADYGPKPFPPKGERATVSHPRDAISGNGNAKFNDETTYHMAYQSWPVKPPRRADVHKAQVNSGVRFSGETMYHSDFKAPKLPNRCAAPNDKGKSSFH